MRTPSPPIRTSTARPPAPAMVMAWLLLAAGISLLVALPELRGYHPQFGWIPFWLALAPLCCAGACRSVARG